MVKNPAKASRKKRLAHWRERMEVLGIKKIPAWKKNLLNIAEDLRYHLSDKDVDYILQEASEIQAENIMRRYRLS